MSGGTGDKDMNKKKKTDAGKLLSGKIIPLLSLRVRSPKPNPYFANLSPKSTLPMTNDEPSSPPSAGKHRRSVDDQEPEKSSKRRKHHHHRHHHRRRHEHHSKHGGERDEVENAAMVAGVDAASSAVPKPGVDDREEGEILEDEEGGGEINGEKDVGMELEGASDVESGEIKAEGADAYSIRVCFESLDAFKLCV